MKLITNTTSIDVDDYVLLRSPGASVDDTRLVEVTHVGLAKIVGRTEFGLDMDYYWNDWEFLGAVRKDGND